MPAALRTAAVYQMLLQPRIPTPVIRGWNRLEGRPRSADLDRSLRAEVRDPIWFLTRQWQFGEFEGEDSGSPVDARVAYRTSPLDGYGAAGQTDPLPYQTGLPLETRVMREPVPFDLVLHIQAAQSFERFLAEGQVSGRLGDYVRVLRLDSAAIAGVLNSDGQSLLLAGRDFLFDAARLISMVNAGTHAALIEGFSGVTATEKQALLQAGSALVAWFTSTYSLPGSDPSTWRPDRLDHSFVCTASQISFTAPGDSGAVLDWFSFDAAPPQAPQPPPSGTEAALSFLPVSIQFAGMPSHRFWEMEDSRMDFSKLDVQLSDVAKLLLAEFVLLFSNDWCLVPLELEIGSVTRVEGILVTDVFGDLLFVQAANQGPDGAWQRWSMFLLDGDEPSNPALLLPPSLSDALDSPALEVVHFLRDEMANLVWAVEDRVASAAGEPWDPSLGEAAPVFSNSDSQSAVYRLGSWIPSNWRPFIPAHVPNSDRSIRLQRARMPDQPLPALGSVLNEPSPYFIAEEEVARSGRIVQRGFRRARWADGTSHLWLNRTSTIGQGQGSSGLAFDQIQEQAGTS